MKMSKNAMKIKNVNNCLSQSGKFGDRYSLWPTPHFCLGMPSCLGLIWFCTVASVDVSSCLVKQGYEATLQLAAGVPLWLNGSIPHQGRWWEVIKKCDMEGYLPIPYPLWSCNCDSVLWVVVVVIWSAIWWHLWAVMSLPLPNVCDPADIACHYTLPEVFTHLLWTLWQTSMIEAIDSHWSTPGKSAWSDTGWSPDCFSLLAYSCYHFPWELA